MKKIISFFLIAMMVFVPIYSLGASVTPITIQGNDANPNQYTPPAGSVRTTLQDSDKVGTHVYKFNEFGELDSSGTDTLTLVIGKASGTSYTQVLSWSWVGNSTLGGIIVKGGSAFNLYEYSGQTSDTNLVAPLNPGGNIADISHVSVLIYPSEQPPVPPEPPIQECCITIIALLIVVLIILALNTCILCQVKSRCCKKHYESC